MDTENPFAVVRGQELTDAEVRDVLARYSRRRPRRPIAVMAGGTAALAAAAALTLLPGGPGERLVEPASAAQRAAAVLAGTPGSVVHVSMAVEQRDPDGSHTRWQTESWQQTTPPYDLRQITNGESGAPVETATVSGNRQLYDAESNTVHVAPADRPTGPVARTGTPAPATAEPLREQVLDLLRRGKLTQSGRSTVSGRETLLFVWNDGQTRYEYTVAAGTYDPVRWRFSPGDNSTETTVAFDTYEILPADQTPLDLTHHHPDATVRHQP